MVLYTYTASDRLAVLHTRKFVGQEGEDKNRRKKDKICQVSNLYT